MLSVLKNVFFGYENMEKLLQARAKSQSRPHQIENTWVFFVDYFLRRFPISGPGTGIFDLVDPGPEWCQNSQRPIFKSLYLRNQMELGDQPVHGTSARKL